METTSRVLRDLKYLMHIAIVNSTPFVAKITAMVIPAGPLFKAIICRCFENPREIPDIEPNKNNFLLNSVNG
jgi:hypothetical protein